MAVYKIFPTKDATLYSAYPSMNTGIDSILEIYNLNPTSGPSPQVARPIIGFYQPEIDEVFSNLVKESNWAADLKLFIAEASGIITDTSIEAFPLTSTWKVGLGQYSDSPQNTDGVSWDYKTSDNVDPWTNPGGDYVSLLTPPQSFFLRSQKDLTLNITSIVSEWNDGFIDNNGILLKLTNSQEFISGSSNQPHFKYYSVDTNTIYPPCLDIKWNDFTYETGSLTEIATEDLFISIDNNPGTFRSESINEFRLNVRPTYPARTYQTSSLYTSNNILPTSSYYAIKDLDTNEFVINFDSNFTKISCDNKGNFFTIYMNGLEPERYYKILIKTEVNGNVIVKDDNYYFKVING